MRRELQAGLAADPDLRDEQFDLDVSLALDAEGRVTGATLFEARAVRETELRVIAFTRRFRFSAAPPSEMPQTVRLRMRGRNRR